MEFLKKEIKTVKTKISYMLNQNDSNKLPYTTYDLDLPIDTTLYSIKIEK
jgi:hypothetical protein